MSRPALRLSLWDELRAKLEAAGILYASQEIEDQREAVVDGLSAILEFLAAEGAPIEALGPIARPMLALAALESNAPDALFAQRIRPGRPGRLLSDHQRTGILAALAELWLRTNRSDDRPQLQKLRDAARQMKGRWFGSVTAGQLKSARELVSQEAQDHMAVRWAKFASEWIGSSFEPSSAFRDTVAHLNAHRLPFGLGEDGISKTPTVSPNDME